MNVLLFIGILSFKNAEFWLAVLLIKITSVFEFSQLYLCPFVRSLRATTQLNFFFNLLCLVRFGNP